MRDILLVTLYPNVENEQTTVKFKINCMYDDPSCNPVIPLWLINIPQSIKNLETVIESIDKNKLYTSTLPSFNRPPVISSHLHNTFNNGYQRRHDAKFCNFHADTFGRSFNLSDSEYRDPDNQFGPKFQSTPRLKPSKMTRIRRTPFPNQNKNSSNGNVSIIKQGTLPSYEHYVPDKYNDRQSIICSMTVMNSFW